MTERLYTQQQIAELLGVTRVAINKRARREQWVACHTEMRRGQSTRFYAFADLPRDIRKRINNAEEAARITARLREIAAEQARDLEDSVAEAVEDEAAAQRRAERARQDRLAEGRKKFAALPKDSDKRLRAKAREWLVQVCAQHRKKIGGTKEHAQFDFALKVNAGTVEMPASVKRWLPQYAGRTHLSEGTLQRWSDRYHAEGLWGLVDQYGQSAGRTKIAENPDLYRVVIGAMAKFPQIKAKRIKEFLAAEHPHLNLVSERRLQAFMTAWIQDNAQLWTFLTHPDRWKNVYMAAAGSVFERIERLNQLWELDSTPGDWLLKDGRHSVVGCIDLHSRRLKLFVSKTSTAAAVKQLLRRCFLDWGMPEGVRTDNGADYVSEEVDSLLRDLQIIHEVCIPFASEEKGTIERAMRTLSHGLLELLPGFAGHSVAERKQIEARKSFAQRVMTRGETVEVALTADELQAKLDEWTDHVYAKDTHGGLDGLSPWAVANAWRAPVRKISDAHALDELLAEIAGQRVIGKKGVRYDNRWFIDPAGVMHEHVGREVTLRHDEHDIGRLAVYLDGAFLCWAEDPEATGIDRREAAAAIKHHQKKKIAEQAAEIRAFTKDIKKDIVQAVIDHRKAQAENIVELPKRVEPYTTPALEAAGDAARARHAEPEAPAEVIDYDRFKGEFETHNARVLEDDDERRIHARWLRVEARLDAGYLVSAEDRRGLEIYRQSGQYRSMQEFYAAFDLTAEHFPD